jgi:hypothetical protein
MLSAELRLRLAYTRHCIERVGAGYFVCLCGCGYIGVCRHCVASAPSELSSLLCEDARECVQPGNGGTERGEAADVFTNAC